MIRELLYYYRKYFTNYKYISSEDFNFVTGFIVSVIEFAIAFNAIIVKAPIVIGVLIAKQILFAIINYFLLYRWASIKKIKTESKTIVFITLSFQMFLSFILLTLSGIASYMYCTFKNFLYPEEDEKESKTYRD